MAAPTPAWMYQQSGVIPYRWRNNKLQVLLITNQKGERWIIPKGIIEPDSTALESAIQEAWEEAGITGQASNNSIGSYTYNKWQGTCEVEVFLFEVRSVFRTWPEAEIRERNWFDVATAAHKVDEIDLQNLIRRLQDHLANNTQP